MNAREIDEMYMRRALQLARNGEGRVSPNPMVGCVIVASNGKIIGEGWHRKYGNAHAEVNAMASVKTSDRPLIEGATLYVSLEPCSHYGKTPPCADMVAASPVDRVVVAMTDPNPKVSGRGIAKLIVAGKTVDIGICEAEARYLNRRFIKAQTSPLPYVTLKWACDASGRMGYGGEELRKSEKYSNVLTQMRVHRLRSLHDAIMVGRRTAEADKPALDVRYWSGDNPKPIVATDKNKPLAILLEELRAEGITSLLVEGGATLLNSFIECGLWDEAIIERTGDERNGNLKSPMLRGIVENMGTVRGNHIVRIFNEGNKLMRGVKNKAISS